MTQQWITTREAWACVAPFEHNDAQRRIFAKLIDGGLIAKAQFYTFDGAEHRDALMPSAFWDISWSRLDFISGKATRVVTSIFAVPNPNGSGMIVPVLANDRATGVLIDRDELLTFWPDKPQEGPT